MVLSDVSIKRPVFATVLSLLLVVLGLAAFLRLQVREYPDIDVPVVKELVAQAADATSYLILGHHVEFTGVCSACQQQNRH